MKALSHYDKKENKNLKNANSPHLSKKNSTHTHVHTTSNSSNKINKTKELNFIVPHSTLYYNNINININELNINSKTSKNKNSHFISPLVNNHKFKSFSKNRKNKHSINPNYNSLDNKNYNKNKPISSKRVFSSNIKNNINIRTATNSINSNENIYTINNINKRNYFINTINNYENNNNRFGENKNNKSKNKYQRILSTEPKEILKFKKHFSFDKKDIDVEEKKIKNDIKQKRIKSNKRSKSHRVKKSHTINTEFGNNNKGIGKDMENNKNKNRNKYDINKLDELFLYMFIDQKYNRKKNSKEKNIKNLMECNKEK